MAKTWKLRKDGVVQRYDVKKGNCYEANAELFLNYFANRPEVRLVHGTVYHPKTGWHGHCWIETGDTIIDAANKTMNILQKDKYYTIGKIKDTTKYTRKEAIRKMLETQHYGPWEEKR